MSKIITCLTRKKTPKPSHGRRSQLGLFFIYIYIYQDITKIGAWVCNLRYCVLRHCHNSNITWASKYTNPLTTRLFAHSMFGLTNKDMVTGGISSQGSHNYAMCFYINTSPYIFILFGSLADICHNLVIVEKRLPADSVSIILSDRYDAFIWDENTMLISFWCRQFYVRLKPDKIGTHCRIGVKTTIRKYIVP